MCARTDVSQMDADSGHRHDLTADSPPAWYCGAMRKNRNGTGGARPPVHPDLAHDALLLGRPERDGGRTWRRIWMDHEELGCGNLVQRVGPGELALAQGLQSRLGAQLLLKWAPSPPLPTPPPPPTLSPTLSPTQMPTPPPTPSPTPAPGTPFVVSSGSGCTGNTRHLTSAEECRAALAALGMFAEVSAVRVQAAETQLMGCYVRRRQGVNFDVSFNPWPGDPDDQSLWRANRISICTTGSRGTRR